MLELTYDEAAMADLRSRGVPIASGPHQPGPNIEFFYVLDPRL